MAVYRRTMDGALAPDASPGSPSADSTTSDMDTDEDVAVSQALAGVFADKEQADVAKANSAKPGAPPAKPPSAATASQPKPGGAAVADQVWQHAMRGAD